MKRLEPIPDQYLKGHKQLYYDPILNALELLINGECLGLPSRPQCALSLFSEQIPADPDIVSIFRKVKNLFIRQNLLTASADTLYHIVDNWRLSRREQRVKKKAYKILLDIFDYSNFREGNALVIRDRKLYWETTRGVWGGFELLKHLSQTIKYCPYCNADTVYAFEKGNKTKVASALDHFYPKSKYPFLALSLYNLVPVCSRCNTQMKGSADMKDVANPYIEDIHRNIVFFPVISSTFPLLDGSCRIVVLSRKGCTPKAIEFVRRFELECLYSSAFAGDALLCMERLRRFTPKFKQYLAAVIGTNDPRLVESLFLGMPLNENEINKTRLGKMTLDFVEQFHL